MEIEYYLRMGIAWLTSGILLFMLAVDAFWDFYFALNAPRGKSAFDAIMAGSARSEEQELDELLAELDAMTAWELTEPGEDGFSHIARAGDTIDFEM